MQTNTCDHFWGTAHTLHVDELVQLVACSGKAGGASSLHLHRHKSNTFFMRKGRLKLLVGDTELILAAGDSFTVRPGIRHRMTFVADSELVELYVPLPGQVIDPGDIVRFDEGHRPL